MHTSRPADAPASAPTDLIMFWNLYEAAIERLDGDHARWEAQRELITAHRPRVLLTTEGWGWHRDGRKLFDDTRDALGMDGVLFPAKTECDLAVFWQPDITRVETETVPPELAAWHGHGAVTLRLPGHPEPLRFAVAHLDPFSPTNRLIESDRLRRYADPAGPPTILAMDANTVPPGDPEPDWEQVPAHRRDDHLPPDSGTADRTPLRRLLGRPGAPLFLDAGAHTADRAPTFGFHPPCEAPRRIDLILLAPALAESLAGYRALDDPLLTPGPDRPAASDHRPVTVRLRRR
ncbi:endonuclease/exonuclease/phosphatase family protein [Streptomyces sp. NPDC001889]